MNTVTFYMRILRAVYNRALGKGLTGQRNPFRHVYTGIDKTVKRAIPLKAIKWIKELDLSLKPSLDFAREVARLANIGIPLTMYVSRHSWASAAKNKNIPVSVICEGMGHDSETTTQIYLASLDCSVIDRANSLILKSL